MPCGQIISGHRGRNAPCRPCWIQGSCTRLSRARTTMNRSDSPTPVCSVPISSLRIPRLTPRRCKGLPRFARISCHMPRSRTPTAAQSCNSGVLSTPATLAARETVFCRPGRYGFPARSHRRPPHLNLVTELNCFRGLRFPLRPTAFSVYA